MRALIRWPALGSLLLLLLPSPAPANVPQTVGMGSRATALGGAFTAQADDFSAIFYNPAGLSQQRSLQAGLSFVSVAPELWLEQADGSRRSLEQERSSGYFFAISGPAGELVDLPDLALGLSLYLPHGNLLHVRIPERPDAPYFPLLQERLRRLSVMPAASWRITDELSIGLGMDLFLSLDAPTVARYRQTTDHPEQRQLEVDITRSLDFSPSFYGGLLYAPRPDLAFGFCYRQYQKSVTAGPSDFFFDEGDSPTLALQVHYVAFFSPTEITAGIVLRPTDGLAANLDLSYALWSDFEGPHGQIPDPRFSDILIPRIGVRFQGDRWIDVMAGYAYHPSPVPEQRGPTNFLDSDRQVISAGVEVHLDRWVELSLAFHAQLHLLDEGSLSKDPALLIDRDEGAPGLQIDQLGYPSMRHGGSMLNLGLSLRWRPAS